MCGNGRSEAREIGALPGGQSGKANLSEARFKYLTRRHHQPSTSHINVSLTMANFPDQLCPSTVSPASLPVFHLLPSIAHIYALIMLSKNFPEQFTMWCLS